MKAYRVDASAAIPAECFSDTSVQFCCTVLFYEICIIRSLNIFHVSSLSSAVCRAFYASLIQLPKYESLQTEFPMSYFCSWVFFFRC